MANIEIFAQNFHFIFSLISLSVLFFAIVYSTSGQDKLFVPLWFLFIGIVLDFGANGIASSSLDAYAQGQDIHIYVFAELFFSLFAMLFMVLSAIRFMISGVAVFWISLGLGGLGVAAVTLFVFWMPDGEMINNMRQMFPLIGIISLSLGFWTQFNKPNNSGAFFSALIFSFVAVLMVGRFLHLIPDTVWYQTSMTYWLLSIAAIMMRVDSLNVKLAKKQQELDKFHHKIEEIIRLSPFPIVISKLGDDKIILANNNACKLFGINSKELGRYRLKDFFADPDNRRLLNERLESEREVQDFEVLVKTPLSDNPFWLLTSANIIDYNYELALYSAFQDITSRKNREVLLKNQALRDPLTSIYNRRYFEEEVNKKILEAKQQNQAYCVLMLDADHFKKVNDTYGHKTGDKVLIELASTTEKALRDNDIVARYGGEEFVVFLPGINAEQGRNVADRLRQSIAGITVYSDEGATVNFTVSIGVSSSDVSDNVDTLIKTADEALYRAKQNGRNRVEIFTAEDLKEFSVEEISSHQSDETHHPVFDKENNAEISLLDGEETSITEINLEDFTDTETIFPEAELEIPEIQTKNSETIE